MQCHVPMTTGPISTVMRPQPVPKNASDKPSAERKQRLRRGLWKQFNIFPKGSVAGAMLLILVNHRQQENSTIFGKVRIVHNTGFTLDSTRIDRLNIPMTDACLHSLTFH
jgi:hypothetical protein